MFYQVPGNTQKKSARAIPTEPDDHCSADSGKTCDDIEILALLGDATTNSAANGSNNDITAASEGETKIQVRTLGGMRLRLRYIKPSIEGAQITKVTWRMGKTGCFYTEYGVNKDACSGTKKEVDTDYEVTGTADKVDWSVYWEPLNSDNKTDWSNWAGTQTSDEGVKCTLKAEYTLPVTGADGKVTQVAQTPYEKDFYIKTRELQPAVAPAQPMKGSDVAMLEAMLWEFGLSPQGGSDNREHSNAGAEGNRIYSERKKGLSTKNCDGTDAKARHLYSAGWENCRNGDVALEGMVRRFQGRNTATCDAALDTTCTDQYAGRTTDTNGKVDQKTLAMLQKVWNDFYTAYASEHKAKPVILEPELSWSNAAISIWDRKDTDFVETYTSDKHNLMLSATNNKATGDRGALLDAWVKQESANKFWGQGRPATPYRIFEGAADEFGSIGYNQIKYAYRYGAESHTKKCPQLKDYNMYKPDENIKGMVAFTVAIGCGSGGGFRKAFGANGAWTTIKSNNADLKGYKIAGETTFHAMDKDRVDDSYELLAKAIASYNGGSGVKDKTWGNMLKVTNPGLTKEGNPPSPSNKTYAIQVLEKFGAPKRTYIWKGGVEPENIPDLDENGKQVEINGIKQTKANPKKGQDWCFVYGESEWIGGKDWSKVKADAGYFNKLGKAQKPVGQISCN